MPSTQPDLPEPAHPDVDSMLSRKFGKEVANYFSGTASRIQTLYRRSVH
jgi:NAD+ diphosphatase